MTDPLTKYPRPPFETQPQSFPGKTAQMAPEPDHGEESYKGSGKLTGKAALVTGGDSGIGRAVAIAYAREGADVAISYLPDEQKDAEAVGTWIEKAGRRALLLPGDIKDAAYAREIVERTAKEFGRLDILVNNAAFQQPNQGVTDIDDAIFEKHFQTNIFGPFYATKAALAHLKPGASVIFTSSVNSKHPVPTLFAYSVAGLVTGAVFVEKIFGWHGMGEWVVQGIGTQDTNIIAAITVFSGAVVLLAGLLSDVIYAILDPRVRVT